MAVASSVGGSDGLIPIKGDASVPWASQRCAEFGGMRSTQSRPEERRIQNVHSFGD
jgi:hypothetical protein